MKIENVPFFLLFFSDLNTASYNKQKIKVTCEPFPISCQQGVKPHLKLASMTGVRLHCLTL